MPSPTFGLSSYLIPIDACPPGATRIFIAVDTAVKQNEESSYTVFLVIATDGPRHYVMDVLRARFDPVEMCNVAERLLQRYRVEKVLIEDSASGPGLHAMLAERGLRSELRPVGGRNKVERLAKHLHFFVDGRIYVLKNQPWTVDFRNELVRFPVGRYDDQVDALTLYLEYMFSKPPTLHLVGKQLGRADGPRDGRSALAQRRAPHAAAGA